MRLRWKKLDGLRRTDNLQEGGARKDDIAEAMKQRSSVEKTEQMGVEIRSGETAVVNIPSIDRNAYSNRKFYFTQG